MSNTLELQDSGKFTSTAADIVHSNENTFLKLLYLCYIAVSKGLLSENQLLRVLILFVL